jgi:actin-related protein
VDVGDQKTSISCVEDGISHPATRVHLNYGGADVTQARLKTQVIECPREMKEGEIYRDQYKSIELSSKFYLTNV